MKKAILLLAATLMALSIAAQDRQRYVGGDISMLPKYEQYNSPYKDAYGNNIDNLLTWLISDCGWNTFRVRLFVHPTKKSPEGQTDLAVCQDLPYVTELGARIKAAGAYFLLDFHYSDSWVDAGHIQAPAAWKGSSDEVMADSIATYTRYVLQTLKAANATPDFVQVGNEIMYGLCDIQVHPYDKEGDNWEGYLGLLRAGCNAVREECPNAQIIIHTDRPNNKVYDFYYYNKLRRNGVDYDIIGLSYYPFWHGYLNAEQVKSKTDKNNLVNALNYLKTQFPEKRVHIVECAYNFQYWPSAGVNYDTQDVWPCSKKGQYAFVRDLVDNLLPLENVDGISYWFPEEAGNGDKGSVMGGWLNRGFWSEDKSTTGHMINRTGQITGDKTPRDVCAPYYMGVFTDNNPQGIETLETRPTEARKTLVNGQIIIERNGRTYNVLGTTIK